MEDNKKRKSIVEMKCPKCEADMKERETKFICRNSRCDFEYVKLFQIEVKK